MCVRFKRGRRNTFLLVMCQCPSFLAGTPTCDCLPEPRWQQLWPSARDRSSSAKWLWGATLLSWTTAARRSLPCLEQQLASWGWLDSMASFFTSSLHFFSPCCLFSRLDGAGTNFSSHDDLSLPEVLWEVFSLTSYFGLSCTGWYMYTKMLLCKWPQANLI